MLQRKQQHEVSLDYLWEYHIEMVQQNGIANIIYVKNFVSETHGNDAKSGVSQDVNKNSASEESVPVENMNQCKKETSREFTPV